jgi:hypothetical protein
MISGLGCTRPWISPAARRHDEFAAALISFLNGGLGERSPEPMHLTWRQHRKRLFYSLE